MRETIFNIPSFMTYSAATRGAGKDSGGGGGEEPIGHVEAPGRGGSSRMVTQTLSVPQPPLAASQIPSDSRSVQRGKKTYFCSEGGGGGGGGGADSDGEGLKAKQRGGGGGVGGYAASCVTDRWK